jgi:3-hydroxyisobutyrate dehydrogenase-like beta-hydroxyacid dehydrogenase
MGMPMAGRIAAAGFELTVFDVERGRCEEARSRWSGHIAGSAAEVAAVSDTILTCLPSEDAVADAFFGDLGIAKVCPRRLTTIDCSTVSPRLALRIADDLARQGVTHLEAAIIGRPPQAESGQLYFVVSGDRARAAAIEPIIAPMARAWRFVGPSGAASRVKLLQNALGYFAAVATAEILGICRALELDCDSFIAIVNEAGGIGGSAYFREYASDMLHGRDGGSGRLRVAAKDVQLIQDLAKESGLALPALAEIGRAFVESLDHGWGPEEHTAIGRLVEARGGRRLFESSN